MYGKRILLGTCLAVAALGSGGARLWTQSAQPSTGIEAAGSAAPKAAEQVYKNIQVLKGVPADQLIPAMQFITASLGVQCDFCHRENAFEKDDNGNQAESAQDDTHDAGYQSRELRWSSGGDLLLMSPRRAQTGECARHKRGKRKSRC